MSFRELYMISRNLARAGLVAAILLGGVGLTACAMENPDATFSVATAGDSLDTAVNDRVEQLLRADVGLATRVPEPSWSGVSDTRSPGANALRWRSATSELDDGTWGRAHRNTVCSG